MFQFLLRVALTLLVLAPTAEAKWFGWVIGGTALTLGIVAIVLIVYSLF